jgi:hypothetical protein
MFTEEAYYIVQGESVCGHLADRFIAMELQLLQNRADYSALPPTKAEASGQETGSR